MRDYYGHFEKIGISNNDASFVQKNPVVFILVFSFF